MVASPRNIILVGFMASGKTSVGRALAESLSSNNATAANRAGRWWTPTT